MLRSIAEKYKKPLSVAGGAAAAFLLAVYFLFDTSPSPVIETIDPLAFSLPEDASPENTDIIENDSIVPQSVIIDVKGAVNYPGVYTLTADNRIVDAVEAAGGYTEDADPVLINHAQKLQDEMVIYIPKAGEDVRETIGQLVQVNAVSEGGGSSGSGKINVNKATDSELTQLPGIGPSKAGAIIQHRSEHGDFKAIEDLKKVTGIGDRTFEQLKDLIDVK